MSEPPPRLINITNILKKKVACITLDIEQDFGELLQKPSYEGLSHTGEVARFFKVRKIPVTCFVQGSLLETHPRRIEELSEMDAEFELHSYSHPDPNKADIKFELERGTKTYREYFHKDPSGYRAPLGVVRPGDYEVLAAHGFKFDSSIFPSVRPGTFNNARMPTGPYMLSQCEMLEFPLGVISHTLRIPFSLSYLRLLGGSYFALLRMFGLPGFVIFDAHLHDLFQLSSAKGLDLTKQSLPYRLVFDRIYRRPITGGGLAILGRVLDFLENKGYNFWRMDRVYKSIKEAGA